MSVESHSQDALPVVLVLGRKLEPDGSASPDLINRVDLARDVALRIGRELWVGEHRRGAQREECADGRLTPADQRVKKLWRP